ncbi:hypothetical protein Tco_0004490 [Tanacetum coccineum]
MKFQFFNKSLKKTFSDGLGRFKDFPFEHAHIMFTVLASQLDTFYNGLNPSDQDSLNSAAGGNLLERSAQDSMCLKFIEYNSKVHNSRNKRLFLSFCLNLITAFLFGTCSLTSCNTVANPRGDLKAITTRSGISYNGPPIPPPISPLPKVVEREPDVIKDTMQFRSTGIILTLEITLRFNDEAITFKVGQTSRYSYNNSESVNQIDVIDVSCEEYAQEVLGFSDSSKSGTL